jgi:hypothetical protein
MNVTDKMLDEAQDTYDTLSAQGISGRYAMRKSIEAAIHAAPDAESGQTIEELEQEIYENTQTFIPHSVMEWMLKRRRNHAPVTEQEDAQAAWFSVDDKLPTSFVQVLALDSQEGYHVSFYSAEYRQWFGADNHHLYDVTHWIALPEYTEVNL